VIPAPLYPESAERAVALFGDLRLPDVAGKPTMRDAMPPWAFDLVRAQFGGLDPDTGRQTIRETLVLIGKKNGKTLVGAGLMLVACILSWRENDEFLILSATKEAATTAYNAARGMVMADDELRELFHVRDHVKEIRHRITGNTIKVVAADSNVVAGKQAGHILVDELSFLAQKNGAEAMLMEATGGLTARPEGWIVYLTTQADDAPVGVFKSKLNYARQIIDGKVEDDTFLPILFEPPRDIRPSDPDLFKYANPSLGYSVDAAWLTRQYNRVKNAIDGELQLFLAKHANIEIGLALRSDRWSGADYWEQNEAPLALDDLIDRSEVITLGIDGGGLDDLLGLYAIGRESGTGRKLGWGHAWCGEIALKRREQIAPTLRGFEQDGDLTIVPTGPDIEQLAAMCAKVQSSGKLYQIGCDPAGIAQIVEAIQNAGVPSDKIIGISQGWKLGSAISTAERWLADGSFMPANQGLMRWAVSNARVEPRANSILITKQASGRGKIDPLMALFDATAIMALNPESMSKKLALFTL
tara:strand:+ start:5846 stop:7429 length:1584 start_codon:yes stop_codon:yes gene_type:complete